MQKKEIKRRRPNNKKPSTTSRSTSNTKNIKKRLNQSKNHIYMSYQISVG